MFCTWRVLAARRLSKPLTLLGIDLNRTEFTEKITAGLAGWLQQLAAQNLESQVGEDAARVEVVRMISAQRAFIPDTSLKPINWPQDTKKRIDIAVLGRRTNAEGWYGAIELKWPNYSISVEQVRQTIVEDAVRVAFAETANMCANLVVIGGTTAALEKLFDKTHSNSRLENQRVKFSELLPRTKSTKGMLTNALLNQYFPDFGDRVPQTVFNGWSRRLATELVAYADARVGTSVKGSVYAWQCKK
jgi:hypothetical protein